MRARRIPWVLPLSLVLVGCGPTLRTAGEGGAAWHELRSAHFVMRGDVGKSDLTAAAGVLERSYGALDQIVFPTTPSPSGRTTVVLLSSKAAYLELGYPPASAGVFYVDHRDPAAPPTFVTYDLSSAMGVRVLQHELTHRFIGFHFPAAPTWLHEGLASLCETMRVESDHVVLGEPPSDWYFTQGLAWKAEQSEGKVYLGIPVSELPSLDDLMALEPKQFYVPGTSLDAMKKQATHYAASWALVHALRLGDDGMRERFRVYLDGLHQAEEDARGAFDAAFASLPKGALSKTFKAFVDSTSKSVATIPFVAKPAAMGEPVELDDAAVRRVWIRLRPWKGAQLEAALRDARKATATAPAEPEGHLLLGQLLARGGDPVAALRSLRQAHELRPTAPRYAFTLADVLLAKELELPRPQRYWDEIEPLAAVVAKAPEDARQQDFLARLLLGRGKPLPALAWAKKAIAADAACSDCYATGAAILAELGELEGAVSAQRVAIHLEPDSGRDPVKLEALALYEAALAKKKK